VQHSSQSTNHSKSETEAAQRSSGAPELIRSLGFKDAIGLSIGTVIGTGVFLKAATMAQHTPSASLILIAWLAAGLLSLMGALCYAELGARFPKAGGEYVYLREAYGPLVAFLFGWTRFLIGNPGSIAAYAVGAATFLSAVVHFPDSTARNFCAVGFVVFFSLLNCLRVTLGASVQNALTALKVLMIFGLSCAIYFFGLKSAHALASSPILLSSGSLHWTGWRAFGTAMLASLWAYDGWNNMPMAAGEIKDPQKNIPRALVIGISVVIGLYLLLNSALLSTLTIDQIQASYSRLHPEALPVATRATSAAFGARMGASIVMVLSIAFVISALGAMHGSILTCARIPYAMAQDELFFKVLGRLNRGAGAPFVAVLAQGLIACLLVFSGSWDQLTDYVVFAGWIFYMLATASLFVFRRRDERHIRSNRSDAQSGAINSFGFKTPFFPWLPILFIGASVCLLVNTVIEAPAQSLTGLAIILFGVPVYYFYSASAKRSRV